jgi:hypothetical protein
VEEMMIKIISMLLATFIFTTYSYAASINPPFSATCEDTETHGYRHGTDLDGKPMEESWTADEHFHSKWKILYSGGNSIIIDGKQADVLVQHAGVIIAGEKPATNGIASGIWTYAIHLGLKKVVATQVNAHGHFEKELQGVKARVVNLNCKFEIHKSKN